MSKTYSMVYCGTRTQIGEFVGQAPVDVPAEQVAALLAKRGTTNILADDADKNTKLYLFANTEAFEAAKADGLVPADAEANGLVYAPAAEVVEPIVRRVRVTKPIQPVEG